MPFSEYARNETLSHWFVRGPVYVSLHSADPRQRPDTELSGRGYGRLLASKTFFSTPENGMTELLQDLEFTNLPKASVAWIGFWDSKVSGNPIFWAELKRSKSIDEGDSFKLPKGKGRVSMK